MDTKHTPGPWEVIKSGRAPTDKMFIRRTWTGGQYVAEIKPSVNDDPEEMSANARLIAAAPALLAALEAICEVPSRYDVCPNIAMEMYDQARAAINKAKGE